MGLSLKQLVAEVAHQKRVLGRLEDRGLQDSDAARSARSNLRFYGRQAEEAERQDDAPTFLGIRW